MNIIITGVGGQGNVLASQVVAAAAVEAGLAVAVGETFGVSQRGGSVMSHVRLSRDRRYGPLVPAGRAGVIVGFEPLETLRVQMAYGNTETAVIMNDRPAYPLGVLAGEDEYPALERVVAAVRGLAGTVKVFPATELARGAGNAVAANMVLTGALAGTGLVPVPLAAFRSVIGMLFDGAVLELNRKAFELGVRAAGHRSGEVVGGAPAGH